VFSKIFHLKPGADEIPQQIIVSAEIYDPEEALVFVHADTA
jgi:hypothetical protein